jgi:hypothetical protein
MTALPSNLALVADDLARATLRDARHSHRRRRLVTYSVAFALLALTATAAIASGWLFGDETPVVRVVPSLGVGAPGTVAPGGGNSSAGDLAKSEAQHRSSKPSAPGAPPLGQPDEGAAQTLLAGLGADKRTLTSVATTTGGVCLTLTGRPPECIPTFARGQHAVWFVWPKPGEPTLVWGIVSDDVTALEVISTGDTTTKAKLGNGGFYAELTDGSLGRLILHLDDGSSQTVDALPCPLTTPDCTP